MNRFYLHCAIFALLGCFSLSSTAQNVSLCREVLSPAGESTERQGVHYDYTIGEAVITTFQSSSVDISLTQGFQQPDECSTVVLGHEAAPLFSVLIFPNPTLDFLYVQYEGEERLSTVQVSVMDSFGQLLFSKNNSTLDFAELDCSALNAGSYFLLFKNESGKELGSFSFIKQ